MYYVDSVKMTSAHYVESVKLNYFAVEISISKERINAIYIWQYMKEYD